MLAVYAGKESFTEKIPIKEIFDAPDGKRINGLDQELRPMALDVEDVLVSMQPVIGNGTKRRRP